MTFSFSFFNINVWFICVFATVSIYNFFLVIVIVIICRFNIHAL